MKKLEVSSFELRVAAFAIAVATSMTLTAATNDFYVGSAYTTDATHFNTVQAAFDAVAGLSADDVKIIHLAAETFNEATTNTTDNVLLLGDERHPENYNIVGDVALYIGSKAKNFEARGVSFYSKAWKDWADAGFTKDGHPGIKQAVFIHESGTPVIFRHCRIIAGQDTLYLRGGAGYFEDCFIQGDTDFIYGGRCGLFNRCDIYSRGGYITADGHENQSLKIGYLFWKCRVNVADGKTTTLGRSWRKGANVWFADCYIGKGVESGLWTYWNDVKGWTVLRDYGTRSETRFTPPNMKGQWGEGVITRGTMEEFWQEMTRFGFDSIDDIFSQEAGDWRPVMRNGIEIREAL